MQIRRFTGALVIAVMTAVALHVSAKPAAADGVSWCAEITAAILNVQNNTEMSQDAKDTAVAALTSIKRYVLLCTE